MSIIRRSPAHRSEGAARVPPLPGTEGAERSLRKRPGFSQMSEVALKPDGSGNWVPTVRHWPLEVLPRTCCCFQQLFLENITH